MKKFASALAIAAAIAVVVPASASALTRDVLIQSSTPDLAASGAWDQQYTLLANNSYHWATRYRDCSRINNTAIRCWWTRGSTPTDQAWASVRWNCLTDKDHYSGNVYRYLTNCNLTYGA